jgi:hypothetical protein
MSIQRVPERPWHGGNETMSKFMLILGGADLDKRSASNPALAPVMLQKYMSWMQSQSRRRGRDGLSRARARLSAFLRA